ncbi:hypothetical protein F4803DRAFT_520003 [Xylaria telfairii]|nr:hypothetical protein F4803DRAFT_520003 [Xylaria telfairii]
MPTSFLLRRKPDKTSNVQPPSRDMENPLTPQVVVERSAILQLLEITLHVVTSEESETEEMVQLVYDLRNRYRDYHRLLQNFFAKRPTLDEVADEQFINVTETDLKKLFSSEEYDEFKSHVRGVEKNFQQLTQSIQLANIKANWTKRLLHSTKDRSNDEKQVEGSYSTAVGMLHTLDCSVEEEQNMKFIKETREVVEIFRSHLKNYGSKWEGFEPLRTRVRIVDPPNVTERLETIDRDLKAMSRLIKNRQLYPRPDFEKQTYGAAWELDLGNNTSDHKPLPANDSTESLMLPKRLSQYELLVEVMSGQNNPQEEVPTEDFGRGGKYRGVCRLCITYRAQNFPNDLDIGQGSGWLIDDDTVYKGQCETV